MQVVVRVLNLALGVLVTALVARLLGRAGYGQWSTVFVVLSLTEYFATFGMEAVVIREASRDPDSEHEWLGAMIMLRLLMLAPVVGTSLGVIALIARSEQMLLAGVILTIAMPFGGAGISQLVFQLRVRNFVPMMIVSLRSLLWGAAVGVIYATGGGMVPLAIALAATNAVGSVAQAVLALRTLGRRPRPSRRRLATLLRVGLPVGLSGMLILAYARVDQVIVFELAGTRPAGLYGGIYSVLDQAHFVPISILTTLAPIIAASWPVDRARMLKAARRTADLMAIASAGALAFVIVAARPLVGLIFGQQFVAGAPALPVLGGAFVFICFGYLNGNMLVVLGLQRRLLWISLLALIVNVAGNLALVPQFGFMGAAWMTLVTEIVVFGASLILILRRLEMRLPHPGRLGRIGLAAVLLWAALALMSTAEASLAALVPAACVLYPALLISLRAVSIDDARLLLRRGATV